MAQQKYVINLKEAQFPMLSEQQPRTIIGNTMGRSPDADMMPGIAYCENVMPTKYGLETVGFASLITTFFNQSVFPANLVDVRVIYDTDKVRAYVGISDNGLFYRLREDTLEWTPINDIGTIGGTDGFDFNSVTVGRVNGISYVFIANTQCYILSVALGKMIPVSLTALEIEDIIGITSSYGYLIAYTKDAIAWSSTTTPTDFTPSQVTGAGGGSVAGLNGDILFVTANSLGILIYAVANIVSGAYTGNSNFPFKFRDVKNAKGGISLSETAYETSSADQYVFNRAGMQVINGQTAETVFPEITDFLEGGRYETYFTTSGAPESPPSGLQLTDIDGSMNKKISYIGARYIVVSYGVGGISYTHALILDTSLKRLGKIKIAHTCVFEYIDTNVAAAKQTIAFINSSGIGKTLDSSIDNQGQGVVIFGKIQATRTRRCSVQGVTVDNVAEDSFLSLIVESSNDGKNYAPTAAYPYKVTPNSREFLSHVDGVNHNLVLNGKFNLVTVELSYVITGRV